MKEIYIMYGVLIAGICVFTAGYLIHYHDPMLKDPTSCLFGCSDTWNRQHNEQAESFFGIAADYSSTRSKSTIGLAVGGANDVDNFRQNIENGYLPIMSDITTEGLFYDYYFKPVVDDCNELFCPVYDTLEITNPLTNLQEHYISVGLTSGISQDEFDRKLLNLVIVMDVSGSMSSSFDEYYYDQENSNDDIYKSKMEVANLALIGLLDHLGPDDNIGVVLFDNAAHIAKPLENFGHTDVEKLKQNILSIYPQGGTNMAAGIAAATELFVDAPENYENRIIFMTDAMPNVGATSKSGLLGLINTNAENEINTTVIGIGVDFNTELIQEITQVRGANYYSVHSAQEFLDRMDKEFISMVTPLAYDLSLTFSSTGYTVIKAFGVPGDLPSDSFISTNTLFPSANTDEGIKGGIILAKLDKLSDAPILLHAKYTDIDGIEHVNVKTVEFTHSNESAIRKAALLAEYADLMQNWIYTERQSLTDHQIVTKQYPIPEFQHLGKWERESVPLSVSNKYLELIQQFKQHLKGEMLILDDNALQQEIRLLNKIVNSAN